MQPGSCHLFKNAFFLFCVTVTWQMCSPGFSCFSSVLKVWCSFGQNTFRSSTLSRACVCQYSQTPCTPARTPDSHRLRGANWIRSVAQIFIHNQLKQAAVPCGWIREKLEKAKEEGNPVGGPAVTINLHPQNLSDTGPPSRHHLSAHMRPLTHIQQRTARSVLNQRWCT